MRAMICRMIRPRNLPVRLRTIGAALALLLLAGAAAALPAAAKPLQPVSVVLDWYPNAVHAFLYVAEQRGYFAEEGLDVAFKMPAGDPTDGLKLVGAGRDTFALYYQPDIVMARVNEGIPIVALAAVVREPLNGIMVPEKSDIRTPRDLEGKRVGYPSIPLNLHMVETMVRSGGGDFDKVRMVDIGWDLIPAIRLGRVDALSGAYINHEYPILEREGLPMRYFHPADYGVPRYYELMLIAGEKTARDRALVDAFWRAATRGFEFVRANPEAGLKVLLENQREEFPLIESVERFSLNYLLPRMQEEGLAFGAQRRETWVDVVRWLQERGVLRAEPDVDALFVHITR